MRYICFFTDPRASELALVGGKGSNLGNMTRAGFPVPPGFCVTVEAYRYLVAVTGLGPIIRRKIDALDFEDSNEVDRTAASIRELIGQQPVPLEIAQEIKAAYALLGEQIRQVRPQELAVAVRSSATAEDLPEASFAGQQDSFLNIRGRTPLLEHVRSCWASLWSARAITYRHKQGFDRQQVLLAVVVQAMIDPESAGIVFTANPVSGRRDECVINASWGLGEAIVAGLVTPDTYVVNKSNGRISQKHIARKEKMIRSVSQGGAVAVDTAVYQRDIPALSEKQVAELTALASRIEDHYGSPQDIEWANRGNQWVILQSRPITALADAAPGVTVPGKYSRAMLVEIFPEAISPAFLSVVSPLLAGMLDFTLRQLGIRPPQDKSAVRAFYSQPYFNVDYLEDAFSQLSPSDRNQLVSQFVNPFAHSERQQRFSPTQLKLLAHMLRYLRRFRRQLPALLAAYRADVAALNELQIDLLSDEEIVSRISTIVFEGASRLLNGDFLLIALAGTFNRLLLQILRRTHGDRSAEILNGLISGVSGNVVMESNKLLWALAQQARAHPEVAAALREQDGRQVLRILQQSAAGLVFLEQMQAVMSICGHREMHLDILYPTWSEDWTPVFAYVRGYLEAGAQQDPAARQALLISQREALTDEVLFLLNSSLPGRIFLAPLFNWLLAQVQHLLRERDTMHYEWTRLFPPARKLLLALGRRWAERRLLSAADDIFFLEVEEMGLVARTPQPVHDLIRERRSELSANLHGPWPLMIENGREIFDMGVAKENGHLHGVAGSPGSVTGRCRIIRGPQEFGRLESGDILVAPLTNPVWTPLFAIASGLVTDVGGVLSHGAIVAREYGIPAVMSVSGATERLIDGQIITVDGDKGLVAKMPGVEKGRSTLSQRRTSAQEIA